MIKLKDHPLMSHRGARSWPPVWLQISGSRDKKVHGEVGILTNVTLSRIEPARTCYLLIDFESQSYMGCLMIDDTALCRQVHDFLQQHIGRSIREIGDFDLGITL
jgi:hypothetical protein